MAVKPFIRSMRCPVCPIRVTSRGNHSISKRRLAFQRDRAEGSARSDRSSLPPLGAFSTTICLLSHARTDPRKCARGSRGVGNWGRASAAFSRETWDTTLIKTTGHSWTRTAGGACNLRLGDALAGRDLGTACSLGGVHGRPFRDSAWVCDLPVAHACREAFCVDGDLYVNDALAAP